MTDSVLRTVVRRETHSPRTGAMLVVVVLLVLAAVYAAVEIALSLAGQPPLLLSPGAAADALATLPTAVVPAGLIAAGVVIAVVGLIVLVIAVAPGRLSRHEMAWDDRAVVVDNGVVASSIAQHLSNESGIARENVVVGVAHRTVDVTVRPPLGIPVDIDRLRAIVDDEVASYRLTPSVRTRVRVERPLDAGKEDPR
ncbi:alkaline shock response membrane anchor protein AmaP [Microbacterium enclense]|uniref:alkaline shock response membrane anchor protein AmaP n=1 Tax=Microbacterium enclense TaxID=993073 RepID=UPI0021A2F945|nr:alkaline shock response membrane anchor protein AmaP [Microbacterium enclense]MCT2086693.1 alkaline shock response membrane anchor protein AmaP [Microbacterium enclense]